jgi:hypothetical protein
MRYRVRGLPAEYQISIVKDASGGTWRIERNAENDVDGAFATPNDALAHLQAEFDARRSNS